MIKLQSFRTAQIVQISERAIKKANANRDLSPQKRQKFFEDLQQALKKYQEQRLLPAFKRRWWCKLLYILGYRPRAIRVLNRTVRAAAHNHTNAKDLCAGN